MKLVTRVDVEGSGLVARRYAIHDDGREEVLPGAPWRAGRDDPWEHETAASLTQTIRAVTEAFAPPDGIPHEIELSEALRARLKG